MIVTNQMHGRHHYLFRKDVLLTFALLLIPIQCFTGVSVLSTTTTQFKNLNLNVAVQNKRYNPIFPRNVRSSPTSLHRQWYLCSSSNSSSNENAIHNSSDRDDNSSMNHDKDVIMEFIHDDDDDDNHILDKNDVHSQSDIIVEDESSSSSSSSSSKNESSSKVLSGKSYSYVEILKFVLTTVCIWLSEPILSLVDTAVVGKKSSTLELAALGPATMVFDSAVYLVYFLAISTTNIVGRALAKGEENYNGLYEQRKAISHALGLAGAIGVFIMFLLGGPTGLWLLQWVAGAGNQSVVPAALSYNRIRSLSAPASILGMVAQAAALASLDTKTPALAVSVASVLNIAGDLLLCAVFQFGIQGAAVATAFAQIASCVVLLNNLKRRQEKRLKRFADRRREGVLGSPEESAKAEEEIRACEEVPFLSLPDKQSLSEFIRLAGPIFFVIVGKLVCYSAMTFKAASFGLMELAAHNVMLRVFFFFATFGDSLSQTAQSYIPSIAYRNDSNDGQNLSLIRQLMKKLLVMGAVISVINSQVAQFLLTNKGSLFTPEIGITSIMSNMSKWMGFSLILHPFIMLFEGSIIAKRDLKYLVSNYAATMGIMLLQLRGCIKFEGVWKSLFLFQVIRMSQFGWRVWRKTLHKGKKTANGAET